MSSCSEKARWLKHQLREGPKDGPYRACMKFSEAQSMLQERFGLGGITTKEASKVVQQAFPNCTTERSTYILGVRRIPMTPNPSVPHLVATVSSSVSASSSLVQSSQTENAQLCSRVAALEQELAQLRESTISVSTLDQQLQRLVSSDTLLSKGPSSLQGLESFSMEAIALELQSLAPDLLHLFNTLGNTRRNVADDVEGVVPNEIKALVSICTLLNCRSQKSKGLQLFLSLMLVARGTNKQAIVSLNHAGVCLSYDMTWEYLKRLTQEANFQAVVKQGPWLWVYDNFNMHNRTRHERQDVHNAMLNTTTRLAIGINHLPPWDFDWDDTCPQKTRQSLTLSELLPDAEDGRQLYNRAVAYTMRVLVEAFPSLDKLKPFISIRDSSASAPKSVVVPMKVLFRDEKYTDENIQILQQYIKDCNLSGNAQVFVGDQSTCKNIRGAKRWMVGELTPLKQLQWVHEVPGDFHFLWECLRVILLAYWGTANQPGALSNLRQLINRTLVDKAGKTFSVADEFVTHAFKAHLIAAACTHFKINSPSEAIVHEISREWLESAARSIVETRVMPNKHTDPVNELHHSFLYAGFQYVDLRNAIRFEEGEQIVRLWKHWVVYFLGTNRKNYAVEAFNLLCNLKASFPKHIAYIATHNRTVNTTGKQGHGKPIDQMLEHYNLVMKQVLRSSGANLTEQHMVNVSLCGPFLLQVAKQADHILQTPRRSTHHTIRDSSEDVSKMVTCLLKESVTSEVEQRTAWKFEDPYLKGTQKIGMGTVEKYINRTHGDLDQHEETDETYAENILDLDYELSNVD